MREQTHRDMETLIETKEFKITFNGSATYFVIDDCGQCRLSTNTLRKAKNHLKRLLKYTNSNETI